MSGYDNASNDYANASFDEDAEYLNVDDMNATVDQGELSFVRRSQLQLQHAAGRPVNWQPMMMQQRLVEGVKMLKRPAPVKRSM